MDTQPTTHQSIVEKSLTVLVFLALVYTVYLTLGAFLGIFTFAIIFAVPFSSLFEKLTRQLGGRRKLAAFLYAIVLLAFVAVPLIYLISALADQAQRAQVVLAEIRDHKIPALPQWLADLPYIGNKATALWAALENDPEGTLNLYEPQLKAVLQKLLSAGGGIVSSALEIIVGIIFSALLLYNGADSVKPIRAFFSKLLGADAAEGILDSSGKAINGVAIGVMGTAVIEALVGWIGFRIAGLDLATGLAALLFLLAVVQLGPVLILIPLIAFMFSKGESGWGVFMIIWLVVLIVVDNVVKPILIGKSGKMPILVLFLGVVGGMAAWGFTGMFKGAIVLAIAYTVFNSWTKVKE